MSDRNEIISAMEICAGKCPGDGCPYHGRNWQTGDCMTDLIKDALELLKADAPRVLTQDEIIGWSGYVWKEYRGMRVMSVALIQYGMERMPYAGDFPTKRMNWTAYGEDWRCWSKEPSDQGREAEPWYEKTDRVYD